MKNKYCTTTTTTNNNNNDDDDDDAYSTHPCICMINWASQKFLEIYKCKQKKFKKLRSKKLVEIKKIFSV